MSLIRCIRCFSYPVEVIFASVPIFNSPSGPIGVAGGVCYRISAKRLSSDIQRFSKFSDFRAIFGNRLFLHCFSDIQNSFSDFQHIAIFKNETAIFKNKPAIFRNKAAIFKTLVFTLSSDFRFAIFNLAEKSLN